MATSHHVFFDHQSSHPYEYIRPTTTMRKSRGIKDEELVASLMSQLTPMFSSVRGLPSLKIPIIFETDINNSHMAPSSVQAPPPPTPSQLLQESFLRQIPVHIPSGPPIEQQPQQQQQNRQHPTFEISFPPSPPSSSTFVCSKKQPEYPSQPQPSPPQNLGKENTNSNFPAKKFRVAKDSQKLEWGTTSCHQCHTKKCPEKVVHCTNRCATLEEDCKKRYCLTCLERKYGAQLGDFKDPEVLKHWVCPHCRGICNCPPCSKKRSSSNGTPSPPRQELSIEEISAQNINNNVSPRTSPKRNHDGLTTSDLIQPKRRKASASAAQQQQQQQQDNQMEDQVSMVLALWKNEDHPESKRALTEGAAPSPSLMGSSCQQSFHSAGIHKYSSFHKGANLMA